MSIFNADKFIPQYALSALSAIVYKKSQGDLKRYRQYNINVVYL